MHFRFEKIYIDTHCKRCFSLKAIAVWSVDSKLTHEIEYTYIDR